MVRLLVEEARHALLRRTTLNASATTVLDLYLNASAPPAQRVRSSCPRSAAPLNPPRCGGFKCVNEISEGKVVERINAILKISIIFGGGGARQRRD